MKMLPPSVPTQRRIRRAILTAAILPVTLTSSVLGATWSGAVSLNTSAVPEDIHIIANSTVTLSNTGGGPSITEPTIFFEPTIATELLTVDGPGLTLRATSTVLGNASTRTITIAGTADFAPGALYTGPTVGAATLTGITLIKNGGAGALLLDDPTNLGNLAGTTLKVFNGLLSIVGDGTNNPVSTLTPSIEIGGTTTTLAPVLRFGSSGAGMTFNNSFNAKQNGTLDHQTATNDTVGSTASVHNLTAGKTLTVNVAAGGALNINGTIGNAVSPGSAGGILK